MLYREAADHHAVMRFALLLDPPGPFRPEVIEVPGVGRPHFDMMPRPRQPLGKLLKIEFRPADVRVIPLNYVEDTQRLVMSVEL